MKKTGINNLFFLFIILSILYLTSEFIFKKIINYDLLLFNTLSEELAHEQVEKLINGQKKLVWIEYFIIPLIILIRSCLVALCLSLSVLVYHMESKIPFKYFFKITLLGEFVFVLVGYFKIYYFYFLKTEVTFKYIQEFYPLSYINFLNTENIEPWLIYPLQTINLFEITYIFVLVYGLWKLLKNKFWKSFEMVVISYGSGLIIWLGLTMFLILNLT